MNKGGYMNRILQAVLGTAIPLALTSMVLLTPGTSYADADCNSIAACVVPHDVPPPPYFQPAFQVNINGPYHVEMDLYSDDSCQTFFDTAAADGMSFGLTTFEYGFPMSSGDIISMKVRVGGCPETACLQVVGGQGICQGF